jgi:hypothetical protein
MRLRFPFGLLLVGALGCHPFDPKHPMAGRPSIRPVEPGYWIWLDDGAWHLRAASGAHAHRFQGSVMGLSGSVTDVQPTRPELRERVALVSDAVQFDIESQPSGTDGFDLRVAGGCLHFDLYLDGHHRPERIHLGPRASVPKHVPFDRCP